MKAFERIFDIIETLRSENGCEWDRAQTLKTLDPLFLEECYELSDAIALQDSKEIKEELGDAFFMLLSMCFIAEEDGISSIEDILNAASDKLVFRHPHVFGDTKVSSQAEIIANWEKLKKEEKKDRKSIFEGIPVSLPDMMRFAKLMRKLKNNKQNILDYKEESSSKKAQLKNLLIDFAQDQVDLVAMMKEINHEIEHEAKSKGL
ncbi:MAG: MazG nucleotide pyrophosphohydrolase domain-containing protein [Brevinema sp.]